MIKLKENIPFICTMDSGVAEFLIKNNYTLLDNKDGKYMFLNDATLKFSSETDEEKEDINKKICYTNVLCI